MNTNLKTESFFIKETLLSSGYDIAVDNEFTLPDYCPPIKRILNIKTEPAVTNKNAVGNTLSLDGVAGIKLLYLDADDSLCSYETAFVFAKNIELSFEIKNDIIKAEVVADKISVSARNERKFAIKGTLALKLEITKVSEKKSICSEKSDEYEMLCDRMTVSEKILTGERNIIIEEDIALSDSHDEIGKIICYYGRIIEDECKIISNKVMIKGTLCVWVTYLSENGYRSNRIKHKISYSQVCDIDGINESFDCTLDERIVFLEVKCRNNGMDSTKTMTVNAKINAFVEAAYQKECDIVIDLYSTERDVETVCEKIVQKHKVERICENFYAKKSLQFSEGMFGNVIDIWSEAVTTSVKRNEDSISVFGTVYVKMIVNNCSEEIDFAERAVDFEYKYPLGGHLAECEYKADVCTNGIEYIITSDSGIDVSCELSIMLDIFKYETITVVTDVCEHCGASSQKDCSVYICFLDEETDIWSVAKEYKSNVSEIRNLNSLDTEQQMVSGALLIPTR